MPSARDAASRSRFGRPLAVGVALGLLLGTAVVVTPSRAAAATVRSTTIDDTIGRAEVYARRMGVRAALAVLDERRHKLYRAGDTDAYYGTASLIKLFVATKLLATGRMTGATKRIAYKMITQSDDAALEQLLPTVGGPAVINWVKQRYHLPYLGTTPWHACWGNTHVTARGMVNFFDRMQRDRKVAPWLVGAMRHYRSHGSDGTDQRFGIPSAVRGAAVKQGWGHCSSDSYGSIINSTGIIGSGRFAVAILTDTNRWSVDSHVYNARQAAVATAVARMLLPLHRVDLPEWHDPVGRTESARAVGSTVTLAGWAYDPDARSASVVVDVRERTALHRAVPSYRRDVNRAYRLTGRHGWFARFAAADGAHTFCVTFRNVGPGRSPAARCYRVTVDGRPRGHLGSATAGPYGVRVTGWAYDPDLVPASGEVRVRLDGEAPGMVLRADRARAAGTYPVAGAHGFEATVAAAPGPHTVCVDAIGAGPWPTGDTTLGCLRVQLPGPS